MTEMNHREIWVDYVKVIACALVVFGHFFQSMIKADILPETALYQWFDQTIYYFHVPLFFICSGYLYQRLSKVKDICSWGRNILKKALNLGVPYLTFSFVTWLLKTLFASLTNTKIGGLFDTLFMYPTSPYWYLYALFFIFLVTPTFRSKTTATIFLAITLLLKILGIAIGHGIQAVSYILANEIWFVIGMCLSVWEVNKYIEKNRMAVPIATSVVFMVLSVLTYKADIQHEIVGFLMGLIACCSVIVLIVGIFKNGKRSAVFGYLAQYTMPIFLMHTLFAAPIRAVLIKIGIQNAAAHVGLGLSATFVGPIVAAEIMKKSKWLEFFLYPGKFIKIR